MAGIPYTTKSITQGDVRLNGGLNTTAGLLGLQDNESTDLQNIDFDKFGSILKRNGYTTANNIALTGTNDNCDGLWWYEFNNSGSNASYLMNITDGYTYKMDSLDKTWDDISGVKQFTAGYRFDFENFLNEAYFTNGVDTPYKWTGSGNIEQAGTPTNFNTASFVKLYNNYLFYGNVQIAGVYRPSRIYWSNIKDTSTWGSANFIEISQEDGQAITGLKVLQDRLVVFKTRSIYNVYFTGDATIPFVLPGGGKSNSMVGCVAPGSIQEVDNGLVFFSYDGFYYYDGANSYKISDKVNKTIIDYNKTRYSSIVSLNQKTKNRYWAAFSSAGQPTNDKVLVWDYFHNAWSLYVGMGASAFATVYVDGMEERPYFADYDGWTYRSDYGSNDTPLGTSTGVNSYYYTNWKHYGDLINKKGMPQVTVYHRIDNSTLQFSYSYDFEDADQYSQSFSLATGADVYGTGIYGTATYAGSGGAVRRRDLTGRGRVVRFKFANSAKGEQFRIDGFGSLPHLESIQ
jgi:hypothetical protein